MFGINKKIKKKCPLDGCDHRRKYNSDEYWDHLEEHPTDIQVIVDTYWEQGKSTLWEEVWE